ncbi:MAG: GNAT family N-acetyltransferase [Proteobacteria bacterium]|nr:GNAT family N-acetyltransferase [Pseudomonadota bacterium]
MSDFGLSVAQIAALDTPILTALRTSHAALALNARFVSRYPAAIAPFAALIEEGAQAHNELRDFAKLGPVALLYPDAGAPAPVAGLDVKIAAKVMQMIATIPAAAPPGFTPETLGVADVPDMLELTALTKPGPFFARTHELGRYIGIRIDGRLAAMAGERMRPQGFTEISAVCVHPDFQGRGHAKALVKALMGSIAARSERPFLHLYADNPGARALYERLGFVPRQIFEFRVMAAPA